MRKTMVTLRELALNPLLVVAFMALWTSPLAGQDAEQLYQQACDDGGMGACHLLGLMYRTGEGVTQDYYIYKVRFSC